MKNTTKVFVIAVFWLSATQAYAWSLNPMSLWKRQVLSSDDVLCNLGKGITQGFEKRFKDANAEFQKTRFWASCTLRQNITNQALDVYGNLNAGRWDFDNADYKKFISIVKDHISYEGDGLLQNMIKYTWIQFLFSRYSNQSATLDKIANDAIKQI